jgi:SNF family Na+-dependent transporter
MVSHYCYENFLHKYMTRTHSSILICVVGFIFGLPFITEGGFYLFELVDNYATLIGCFTVSLMETYLVTNYIGLDVIKEIVANKTGKVIPEYVFFSIKYLCPIAHAFLIIVSFSKAVRFF